MKIVLKTLFLFSFALAQLSYGDISVDDRCKNEIEKIFKTSFENNKDKVYQFLSNQAHLTLHRLAWAHLKTFQADSKNVNTRLSKVENTIIQSLKHKYSKTYAEELKNFSETAQDRYREVLSNMSSDLINLIQTEKTFKETNEIYHLNYQDVFLIDLLGEIEKSDDYKERYAQQEVDKSKSDSQKLLNLVTMINSSLTNGLNYTSTDIQSNINRFEDKINKVQKESLELFRDIINGANIKTECLIKINGCDKKIDLTPDNIFALSQQVDSISKLLKSTWYNTENTEVLINNLKWCNHYLNVCANEANPCPYSCENNAKASHCPKKCNSYYKPAEESKYLNVKCEKKHAEVKIPKIATISVIPDEKLPDARPNENIVPVIPVNIDDKDAHSGNDVVNVNPIHIDDENDETTLNPDENKNEDKDNKHNEILVELDCTKIPEGESELPEGCSQFEFTLEKEETVGERFKTLIALAYYTPLEKSNNTTPQAGYALVWILVSNGKVVKTTPCDFSVETKCKDTIDAAYELNPYEVQAHLVQTSEEGGSLGFVDFKIPPIKGQSSNNQQGKPAPKKRTFIKTGKRTQ